MSGKLQIMLIDDSLEDAELFTEVLRMTETDADFTHIDTGRKALDQLLGSQLTPTARHPDLIFLDLNLPGIDGREILDQLKQTATVRKIPVIIMTTSASPSDIEYCYDRGANSFFKKPIDLTNYIAAFEITLRYWLRIAMLPSPSRISRSS